MAALLTAGLPRLVGDKQLVYSALCQLLQYLSKAAPQGARQQGGRVRQRLWGANAKLSSHATSGGGGRAAPAAGAVAPAAASQKLAHRLRQLLKVGWQDAAQIRH
jgi:hypothetical protein